MVSGSFKDIARAKEGDMHVGGSEDILEESYMILLLNRLIAL